MNRRTLHHGAPLAIPPALPPALALGLLALAAGQACAQATPPAGGQSAAASQTVTISATRRLEAIRDVPVSVVKLSTDGQLDLGAKDLVDVLATVPGVSYNQTFGKSGSGDIVIRGVTTGNVSNPTVGIYIDDVPIGGTSGQNFGASAFDQRLLDLASIEVLKGPQGTLYGAGAMGGLLKYNTRLPDAAFLAGQLGGEASRTNKGGSNHTLYGNVNVPLSSGTAALRAAVFHARDGGYTDATGPGGGKDVNSGTVTGARLALGLRPAKGWDVRLSAQSQESKYDGTGVASYDTAGKPIAGDLVATNLRFAQPSTQRMNLATAAIDVDLGWAKASSITGYQTKRTSEVSDQNFFLLVLPPFLGVTQIDTTQSTKLDKTTQEFRLVSTPGGQLEWLAGVFYANEKGDGATRWVGTTTAESPFPSGTALLDNAGIETHWKETALYGTVVWNLSPALALTAGARVARNSLDQVLRNAGPLTDGTRTATSTEESPATYLLAARYKLSPSASVYARIASGYRAGGPNAPFTDLNTGQQRSSAPYRSDSLWSYELGYKADLPDGLGRIDVAAFQIDWKDLQVQVFSNGVSGIGNAGRARSRGLEFGSELRPLQALTLRAAASYIDARLTEDSPGLGGAAGERLPTAPRFAASLGARVDAGAGFLAANIGHTGARTVSFAASAGTPNYQLPAYTTLDLNAGTTLAGFDLGVYVRNITDERGQISAYTQFAGLGVPVSVNFIRPRTIGLTLSRSF
jgi:outer membrane receptor protein involved in Fe transport